MPEKDESALSQDAIDELLAGARPADYDEPEDETAEDAFADETEVNIFGEEEGEADEGLAADEDEDNVTESTPPQVEAVDERTAAFPQSTEASQPFKAAINPIAADIDGLKSRVDAIEQGLQKIASLEKQIESLKKSLGNKKETEILRKKVSALETGARNTPVFNLYEKMACSSCGTHGAAQVKTRCPSCGKEGWFGRRTPADASPAAAPVVQVKPAQRPVQKPAKRAA